MSGDWLDAVAAENIYALRKGAKVMGRWTAAAKDKAMAELRADAHRIADHLAFRHTYEECVEMIYDALLRARGGR